MRSLPIKTRVFILSDEIIFHQKNPSFPRSKRRKAENLISRSGERGAGPVAIARFENMYELAYKNTGRDLIERP